MLLVRMCGSDSQGILSGERCQKQTGRFVIQNGTDWQKENKAKKQRKKIVKERQSYE